MALLPIETWRQIFKNHLHLVDWLSLATTFSLFRLISQEMIYENLTLTRVSDGDEDYTENKKLALFTRSLKERPELAALVRRLDISYSYEEYEEHPKIFDYYENHFILLNLHLFPTLTHLHVERFLINTQFLSALRSPPRLSGITFNLCNISEALSNVDTLTVWLGSSISAVVITQPISSSHPHACAAICPISTRSLQVNYGEQDFANYRDPWFFGQVFTRLQALGVAGLLTTLSIVAFNKFPPNLVSILVSCPQLRRLTLKGKQLSRIESLPLDSLHSDSIPLLEEYKGPAKFVEQLIPDRPVHTVALKFHDNPPVHILMGLQRSAVPVVRLIIAGLSNVVDRQHQYLIRSPTSIASLTLKSLVDYQHADLYCLALSHLTSLAVIKCYIRNYDVEMLPDVVHKFSTACPSIKELDFAEERWLARSDGGWERYL